MKNLFTAVTLIVALVPCLTRASDGAEALQRSHDKGRSEIAQEAGTAEGYKLSTPR